MAVRLAGDSAWIKFFLRGVFEVSQAATATARKILALREEHRQRVKNQALLDYLFEQPLVSINMVQERLGCGFPTASKYVEQFVTKGIMRETTASVGTGGLLMIPYPHTLRVARVRPGSHRPKLPWAIWTTRPEERSPHKPEPRRSLRRSLLATHGLFVIVTRPLIFHW